MKQRITEHPAPVIQGWLMATGLSVVLFWGPVAFFLHLFGAFD